MENYILILFFNIFFIMIILYLISYYKNINLEKIKLRSKRLNISRKIDKTTFNYLLLELLSKESYNLIEVVKNNDYLIEKDPKIFLSPGFYYLISLQENADNEFTMTIFFKPKINYYYNHFIYDKYFEAFVNHINIILNSKLI